MSRAGAGEGAGGTAPSPGAAPRSLPPVAKRYVATRDPDGRCRVEVEAPYARYPLAHVARHSPPGWEWSCSGSGPSDTALCILADLLGWEPAGALYHQFKEDFVAPAPRAGFVLEPVALAAWLEEHEDEVEADRRRHEEDAEAERLWADLLPADPDDPDEEEDRP